VTTALITQAQVETRIGGPAYLVRLTDDDGDGTADAAIVTALIAEATATAVGLLKPGFQSYETVAALAADDESVMGAIVDIALGLFGARKQEFHDEQGRGMFWMRRRDAEALLSRMGTAKQRAKGEQAVGRNRLLGTRVSRNIATDPYVFQSSSRDRKGPGGF
jgi:hypothetical protein